MSKSVSVVHFLNRSIRLGVMRVNDQSSFFCDLVLFGLLFMTVSNDRTGC